MLVAGEHLPGIALVAFSIVLHNLKDHIRLGVWFFDVVILNGFVVIIFTLGALRIIKWSLIDLFSGKR